MPSAAARTFASSTLPPQTFHEFHPSGGVSASTSAPPTMAIWPDAFPRRFDTVTSTIVRPDSSIEPLMIPDAASSRSPRGRFRTLNVSGASPVAGMRNRNGRPGVVPTIRGELRRGCGCRVATIAADSAGSVTTSGRACASRASSSNAPPQITSSSRRPSPPSLTERMSCFVPLRSALSSFGASPLFITPDDAASLPSTQTSNVALPTPDLRRSSTPTIEANRVAAPFRSMARSVFTLSGTPCTYSMPPSESFSGGGGVG